MAEELSQDAVLLFLQSRGGSVPNADLLLHFRPFLREHADRERNRELFKSFVNSVARVKQEHGVSHVVLQRRFRHGQEESPGVSTQRNVHLSPLWNADKSRNKSPEPRGTKPGPVVLPAAGIILSNNNNNNTVQPNLNQQSAPCRRAEPVPLLPGEHTGLPDTASHREVKAAPVTPPEPREPKLSSGRPSAQPHSLPEPSAPPAAYGAPVSPRQALNNNRPRQRQPSSKPVPPHVSVSVSVSASEAPVHPRATARHRQSYRSALSLGDGEDSDDDEEQGEEVPDRTASPAPVKLQGPGTRATSEEGTGLPQKMMSQGAIPHPITSQGSVPPQKTSLKAVPPLMTSQGALPPQITSLEAVPPLMTSHGAVPPQMMSQGAVSPQMTSKGVLPPQITSLGAVSPQMTSKGVLPPQITSLGAVPPQMMSQGAVSPQMTSKGVLPPQITSLGAVPPQMMSQGAVSPQMTSKGVLPPQITSLGAVPPQMTSQGAPPPQITSQGAVSPQMTSQGAPPPQITSQGAVSPQMTSQGAPPPQITSLGAVPPQVTSERAVPQIHIQDVDQGFRRAQEPQSRFRTGFPLPIHSLSGSRSRVEQAPRAARVSSGWSSCEELTRSGHSEGPGAEAERSWSAQEESPGETRGRAWHRSTGDLFNDGADTSTVSAPSPPTLLRPVVARRQSSNLKRMCLSVGADLDQLMDEDDKRALGGSEAARLHRLHLISSSLSLGHMSSMSSMSSCSTPPRCHSLADLSDREQPRERPSTQASPQHHEGSSRQSQVPLEEREHLWLVKAASGMWPDIYSLFREEPSLLHRRDFMSGFTVLHWIAKHGDHRVLNTLWYGVEKAGLMFDTEAQSSCGYTPLHIAAIHNHKNIIRLLVNKFKADVSLRDVSGRKAWFYLPTGAPPELFQLLGAPAKAALGPTAEGQTWATPQTHPQTQRRRRRHRFSTASGQRPLTFSGDAKVKRSSSLAAFLKHKSLQKVKAEWAI